MLVNGAGGVQPFPQLLQRPFLDARYFALLEL